MKLNKQYSQGGIALLIAVLTLAIAPILEEPFSRIVSVASFLTWHNLFELAGVVACLAIFLVAYFTYNQTGRLKIILLGNMLLAAGFIDVFHMLSYKGMPAFFIENISANRATTFWVAARMMSAIGFLIASFLTDHIKCNINKNFFTVAALFIVFAFFITATYFPTCLPVMYIEGTGLTAIKKLLEYFIMLMLLISAVAYLLSYMKNHDKVRFTMFYALLFSVLSEFTFSIYIDVYGIYNYAGHVLKVVSMFMVFKSIFIKNVQAPYIELTDAQKTLKDYADNLDKTVEKRTRQMKAINMRLMEDLEYARDIQKSMLPVFLPDAQEIGFSALYLPTERLSGDFYDVFKLDENHLGFYVCDVSGHGVPAAMLTVFLKQCVDGIVAADRHKGTISQPACVLQQVYDAFNYSNFKDDVYIVLIYSIYNVNDKSLICSSAGLNVAPLVLKSNGDSYEINTTGFPICKLKDVCAITYTEFDLFLKTGDKVFLYTDGLIEARNCDKDEYSITRLKQLLKAHCNKVLTEQVAIITEDLLDFSAGERLKDDVTLLAIEIR